MVYNATQSTAPVNALEWHKKDDPEDIYYYRPDAPEQHTETLFEIRQENGKLRVKNKNVNCLFSNLTPHGFDKAYNEFFKYLNLNFQPIAVAGKLYGLQPKEQEKLVQHIITSWIYFYTINGIPLEVKRSSYTHPYMVDYVLQIMDKKFGIDTPLSLSVGAGILRQSPDEYSKAVQGRRRYYDR